MRALIVKDPSLAGKVETLYESSGWAVVQSHAPGKAHAVVFRLVGNKWVPDRSGKVKLAILGPQPGRDGAEAAAGRDRSSAAKTPFVESALWVDGTELLEKGGGSPTRGTIYGRRPADLKPGEHVAVGYARTALSRQRRRLGLQRRLIRRARASRLLLCGRIGIGGEARPDLGVLVTALLEVERPQDALEGVAAVRRHPLRGLVADTDQQLEPHHPALREAPMALRSPSAAVPIPRPRASGATT